MFKTPEGQARYFAAYEKTFELWPVPRTSFFVETEYGPTHVHASGPPDGPAALLIPGAGISSSMWYANIEALSQAHRVYALDVIGDPGKSVMTVPVEGAAAFRDWLRQVAAGLGLDKFHVVGLSFGGYLAAQMAVALPDKVASLTLLSPANVIAIRWWNVLNMFLMFLPWVSFERKHKIVFGNTSPRTAPLVEQMLTPNDFRYHNNRPHNPPLLTDEEFQSIAAPTLVLMGENEVFFPPDKVIARLKQYVPTLQADILPGAGHAVNLNQPKEVDRRILAFWSASRGNKVAR